MKELVWQACVVAVCFREFGCAAGFSAEFGLAPFHSCAPDTPAVQQYPGGSELSVNLSEKDVPSKTRREIKLRRRSLSAQSTIRPRLSPKYFRVILVSYTSVRF